MSQLRNRQIVIPGRKGYVYQTSNGALLQDQTSSTEDFITQDTIGNWSSMNAFSSNHRSIEYTPMNGVWTNRSYVDGIPAPMIGGYFSVTHLSSGFMNTTQAIALTNPGEPLVDVPNFLFELKDFPSMFKHVKNRAKRLAAAAGARRASDIYRYMRNPRNLAEDWLNFHFGWAPFVSDLTKLPGVMKDINQRMKDLQTLRSQGWVSRRRQMGRRQNQTNSTATYVSNGVQSVVASRVTDHSTKKWLVARWRNNSLAFGALSDTDALEQFRKAALGLDYNLTHVWDLMPWSWLVDWFTDIGNVVHIYSNRFGWSFVQACLCEHTILRDMYNPQGIFPPWMLSCQRTNELKSRSLVTPSIIPAAFGNYLNGSQLTTLAALASARVPR